VHLIDCIIWHTISLFIILVFIIKTFLFILDAILGIKQPDELLCFI